MPPKGFRKPEPIACRIKVGLSENAHECLTSIADAAGMTTSDYIRRLIEADADRSPSPQRPVQNRHTLLLPAEIHDLAIQIRKLGSNVNQLARARLENIARLSSDRAHAQNVEEPTIARPMAAFSVGGPCMTPPVIRQPGRPLFPSCIETCFACCFLVTRCRIRVEMMNDR